MARPSVAELEQAIVDVLASAGEPVTHNDLVASLDANGNGQAAFHILGLQRRGVIVAHLKAQPAGEGAPVLRYSLPGGE